MPATTKARIGAMSAGTTTFSSDAVAVDRAGARRPTNAAPTTPPISACDELDGRPKYQVARFQAIAPIRPAKTTSVVIALGVDDALGDRRGDLQRDERADEVQDRRDRTATRGDIARVEIDVAIALAVSWKPFVKSNASAVATTMTRMMSLSMRRAS